MEESYIKSILQYDPEGGLFYRKDDIDRRPIGYIDKDGYWGVVIKGKHYKLHRLAFLLMGEEIPKYVDHINGMPGDNRWLNLRSASHSQNCCNQKIRSTNTSGVKNVCFDKRKNKWCVKLRVDGKRKHIGYYSDIEEAESAAIEARSIYHKEFANHG